LGKKEGEAENDNGEKLLWSEDPGLQFLSYACESYGGLFFHFFHAKDNQMKRCGMDCFPGWPGKISPWELRGVHLAPDCGPL